jgi:hypothetical protein
VGRTISTVSDGPGRFSRVTNESIFIDTSIDLHFDARGKDPDRYSPTLRRYHRQLWSKPLPTGRAFELEDVYPKGYLLHRTDAGSIMVSSDTIIRTFRVNRRMQHIISKLSEPDVAEFSRVGYSIGGMMIFPKNRIDNQHTINQARGTHPKIEDRFDLTLECIRRHYEGGPRSPLTDVLERYGHYFELFGSFRGYVDFFLLQDLVVDDYSAVRFFAPFTEFTTSGLIASVEEYEPYRALTLQFVRGRNARIDGLNTVSKPEGITI